MPNGISDSPQKRTRFTHEWKDVVEGKKYHNTSVEERSRRTKEKCPQPISVRTYFIFRAAYLRYRHFSNGRGGNKTQSFTAATAAGASEHERSTMIKTQGRIGLSLRWYKGTQRAYTNPLLVLYLSHHDFNRKCELRILCMCGS